MKERLLKPIKKRATKSKWMDGFVLSRSCVDDLDISQARARVEIKDKIKLGKRIKVVG